MNDLPTGTLLRYDESKSSHGVTMSIEQFIEWGVLFPVAIETIIRGYLQQANDGAAYTSGYGGDALDHMASEAMNDIKEASDA